MKSLHTLCLVAIAACMFSTSTASAQCGRSYSSRRPCYREYYYDCHSHWQPPHYDHWSGYSGRDHYDGPAGGGRPFNGPIGGGSFNGPLGAGGFGGPVRRTASSRTYGGW